MRCFSIRSHPCTAMCCSFDLVPRKALVTSATVYVTRSINKCGEASEDGGGSDDDDDGDDADGRAVDER